MGVFLTDLLADVQHVIWDWNGTLLDDRWLCVLTLNGLLEREGRGPIDEQVYLEHFGFPVLDFYDWLGFAVDGPSFEDLSTRFISGYHARAEELALQPHTEEVLGALQSLGIPQSVLSASRQDHLEKQVRHAELGPYFEALCGTDTIHAHGKVGRGQDRIAELQIEPQQVLMVGDTTHDLEVAEAMGVRCLLVAHGHHSYARLEATGCPVVHDFSELRRHLSALAASR
ncbi:MAG: haloacid dehalogenase domain-containing protein hydrolase [Puniceicoccaceae bacterium 5H]|nr:MAG: haloacid dehalogenase domain-containing protein hydrolase [Puniceicoccaceae bacterium 5H]